jgi:hypothetical protein
MALISSCGKRLNESVTLRRTDKIPYGAYYAYEHLPYMFSDAVITVNKWTPTQTLSVFDPSFTQKSGHRRLYFILSPQMDPSTAEVETMLDFARTGNYVFISSFDWSKELLDSLDLATSLGSAFYDYGRMPTLKVWDLTPDSFSYTYPGRSFDNYFVKVDTGRVIIHGRNVRGFPNFVEIPFRSGAVFVHASPVAFTNFFLLHNQNKSYYDKALSHVPSNISEIFWDDYFRYHRNEQDPSAFSKLSAFMKHEGLKWAVWLTILLFGIIYIFESKRKQRLIPSRPAPANSTVDFVKTVGRLYFQRKDNKNLASKMMTHFIEQARSRYNIRASAHSDDFVSLLARKSGVNDSVIRDIFYSWRMLSEQESVSDSELINFELKLEGFNTHV